MLAKICKVALVRLNALMQLTAVAGSLWDRCQRI